MIEILSHQVQQALIAAVAALVAWFGVIHTIAVFSRMMRHLAGEMRRQARELREELLEWRRFFSGP